MDEARRALPGTDGHEQDSGGVRVKVTRSDDTYLVSDADDPEGPVLRFTQEEWVAFVEGVRAGEFD